jgi:antitoxin component YwqK of YwqJK toxin-antitoxin module
MNKTIFCILVLFLTALFENCEENGIPDDGVKRVYFEDHKTLRQTIEYKNGKKNGHMKEFYRSGVLKAKQYYINDALDDTSAFYFDDGRLRSLQVYKNKLKHGCWKDYNKDGKLYSEVFFKNGLLDSTSSRYTYRTLKLLTRVTYKDGKKNGAEERYHPNGKPMSFVYYEAGMPCIGTREWKDDGKEVINDFSIVITERDELLLKNKFTYFIHPKNIQASDKAYIIAPPKNGRRIDAMQQLKRSNDAFLLEYSLPKGGYVMSKEYIAVFRKTAFGNTFIKVESLNVAINNY